MPRFLSAALIAAASSVAAAPAIAAPRVATDIAPVHSLAAQVMEGVGEPDLLMAPGASPHGYSMRPSEAQALQDAEIVFWIGEALTPWLERGIETLASDAEIVELLGAGGSEMLPSRDTAIFEHGEDHHDEHKDDHDKHDDDHDKHDEHEDHADEDKHHHDDHAGEKDHEEHAGEGGGHDHHDHGENDPHAWLDPDNAKAWADLIAATLAKADPANAAAYVANAAAAKARLDVQAQAIAARLNAVRGKQFIVFHDAYQYFEHRFDMPSSGALSLSDARKPSPARITEIRDHVAANDITCVFAEPQFNAGIVNAVSDGADIKSGVMDPLGSANAPGADFYSALIDDLAAAVVDCLAD